MRTHAEPILASAFSLNMLGEDCEIRVRRWKFDRRTFVDVEKDAPVRDWSSGGTYRPVYEVPNFYSVVGHEGTARLLSRMIGFPVEVNREAIKLRPGDEVYVAQPIGGRLQPGQELEEPDLHWFEVDIYPLGEWDRGYSAGYEAARRKYDPSWLDEDEAREDEAIREAKKKEGKGASHCPSCGKELPSKPTPEQWQNLLFGFCCFCGKPL